MNLTYFPDSNAIVLLMGYEMKTNYEIINVAVEGLPVTQEVVPIIGKSRRSRLKAQIYLGFFCFKFNSNLACFNVRLYKYVVPIHRKSRGSCYIPASLYKVDTNVFCVLLVLLINILCKLH